MEAWPFFEQAAEDLVGEGLVGKARAVGDYVLICRLKHQKPGESCHTMGVFT
jgi:hypothetical protein